MSVGKQMHTLRIPISAPHVACRVFGVEIIAESVKGIISN
jgi:hypothetical protein